MTNGQVARIEQSLGQKKGPGFKPECLACRKRYSGSTLPVPDNVTSASSREGGDEYSSEASEMDTQVFTIVMPPTLKKLRGDIAFRLSVRACVSHTF